MNRRHHDIAIAEQLLEEAMSSTAPDTAAQGYGPVPSILAYRFEGTSLSADTELALHQLRKRSELIDSLPQIEHRPTQQTAYIVANRCLQLLIRNMRDVHTDNDWGECTRDRHEAYSEMLTILEKMIRRPTPAARPRPAQQQLVPDDQEAGMDIPLTESCRPNPTQHHHDRDDGCRSC